MEFANDASGAATVRNTVISKRVGSGLPDYWSTNTAMGTDPDTGRVAAFYSSYTTSNLKLYKHVSGTDTVTDQIAGGATRNLPGGVNWGGLGADPRTGMLYGAQNGGAPVLFGMDLATGTTRTWSRGSTLTSVPANDLVFAGGTLVPDIFVDVDGGVYYGIVYSGSTYIYRLDPATGATAQAVRITGAGAGNGFNNYGMAFFDGAVYLGYYGGALYRADPRTGVPVQVAGGNAQDNQTGRISSESGGSWPITDLASCAVAPNLTSRLVVAKAADTATAKPGGTGRYTVTARNDGAVPVTGAVVTDDLGEWWTTPSTTTTPPPAPPTAPRPAPSPGAPATAPCGGPARSRGAASSPSPTRCGSAPRPPGTSASPTGPSAPTAPTARCRWATAGAPPSTPTAPPPPRSARSPWSRPPPPPAPRPARRSTTGSPSPTPAPQPTRRPPSPTT